MNTWYTYPKEERWAGRPTKRISQIYHQLIDAGAEMGFHSGSEQPNWFVLKGDSAGYKPSFRRTNWFEPVGRECRMVTNHGGIVDLSPFAKFRLKGSNAATLLDRLISNTLPKIVGYTTSGAYGYNVGHSVAFAYLPPYLTVPGTEVQVELLGSMKNAVVLPKPPVDIESARKQK